MNYLIKQQFKRRDTEVASMIIVGMVGDKKFQEEWATLVHNYSITDGKIFRMTENFAYFITDSDRLVNGLATFFRHQLFCEKILTADELELECHVESSRQKAVKFIEEIPFEPFYTRIHEPGMEYSVGCYQDE